MLQKLQITFNVFIIFLLSISISKAELLKPKSDIKPSKVVEIQLNGLKKNDFNYKKNQAEALSALCTSQFTKNDRESRLNKSRRRDP